MSTPEEILDIDTPENVAFGYQVAGLGSRFLSTLLDTLLIGLLQVMILVIVFTVQRQLLNRMLDNAVSAWVYAIFGAIAFLFYWGYYIFFELLWNGQSPGKRWAGVRVIRSDGMPITISESLIRNLVRLVDLLPAAYGVGIVVMFIDRQSRRLGDLAAGTLVVHDQAPISIQSLSVKRAVNFTKQGFTNISLDGFPVDRLTDSDLNLIEDFISRRDQLTHRNLLAIRILGKLHARLGLPAPTLNRTEAEDTLLAILQTAQKQQADVDWKTHDTQRTNH